MVKPTKKALMLLNKSQLQEMLDFLEGTKRNFVQVDMTRIDKKENDFIQYSFDNFKPF